MKRIYCQVLIEKNRVLRKMDPKHVDKYCEFESRDRYYMLFFTFKILIA